MSTIPATQAPGLVATSPPKEVHVYSHSGMIYWWPVWFIGYIMALLTFFQGQPYEFGDTRVLIHPSRNLGVLFTMTFLLVIIITHLAVRGIASITVIITLIAITLFFAWMGWWERVFQVMGSLAIFMNLGFYLFFSTAVFLTWFAAVFAFDRLEVWKFRPGQMVHETILGTGEQTYDARGIVVEKLRSDLFRHWILGLGSGDLHIATTGARKQEFVIPNVPFIGYKLQRIQELAAMRPDETPDAPNPTPQQMAPQQMAPQQMVPQQVVPQHMVPQHMVPPQ